MSVPDCRVGEADELGVDSKTITHYIQSEWDRPIALSVPGFYNWQFRQSPDNAGKDRCLIVVDGDNEVFGFMGLNTRKFYLGGRCLEGAELTTWMISEKIRGAGYGRAILQYLEGQYEVLLGMGITEMALYVYMGLGFKYVRYIPRYVRVFNPDAVHPISNVSPLGSKLIQQYASIPKMSYESYRIDFSDTAQLVIFLHKNFNCFSRDVEYLEWRYAHHPVYHYEIFHIKCGDKSAAVILRVDEKNSLKIVHVIDIFGEESAFPAVVNFLETLCQDINADLSDFYCTSPRIGHIFWYYGWFSILHDYYIEVPHLFYPIEMRSPPTTSLTLWAKYDMCSLLDQSQLYITKGDCDLDRPTIQYLQEKRVSL